MMQTVGIAEIVKNRVLILDGAMGTMIQAYGLSEEDFRGSLLLDNSRQMQGNNDILVLTRPDVVSDIHRCYLQAGADIICTNTFNAQRISQADYHCEHLVAKINREAVCLARQVADEYSTLEKPRFVIASVGPTNQTCSMSPDVNNPAFRAVSYDELKSAYLEQMLVLLECGVDAVLLETIFDTLNAKAAIAAFQEAEKSTGKEVPLMLSVTVSDRAGRLLSGQNLEAFLVSVSHVPLFSVGLNCSFGAKDMLSSLRTLSQHAPYYISAHPNAGLPNSMGGYDQTPEKMKEEMRLFLQEGLVNIIGGCCGTTPEHIHALAELVGEKNYTLRVATSKVNKIALCGLEPLIISCSEDTFVNVGERCNVAGSRKFLRLIQEGAYSEALEIARRQVEDGAMVLDINMDDGLLDARKEMQYFLNLIAAEPDICRVPIMIDSSDWEVIRAGLKCVQGKCIVNSISLKEGEDVFLSHAREVKDMGAAVVVMAFDEQGQADTLERRISVCQRAYELLVKEVGLAPGDIIFDPNVLAVATGMPEHDTYAYDFIRATEWISHNLPDAHVSGGVSNLSFSFRGNNYVREAMHAVFLYHARQKGMDFGIANPSAKVMYSDIPQDELLVLEDVILRPSVEARERLIEMASCLMEKKNDSGIQKEKSSSYEGMSVEDILALKLQKGISEGLDEDIRMALEKYPRAVDIIEGPLMKGMNQVGTLFGEGKMFLPQVVKTARTMKYTVSILQPYIEAQKENDNVCSVGRVLLATVKGDVHDIGKNIVSVVMACNGYEVIDLGVMVPAEEILSKVQELKPDVIGLSGLITPSLEEMVRTVSLLKKHNVEIPIMIGGATTSALHTALKIAPQYDGPVIWVKDASRNAPIASQFLNREHGDEVRRQLWENQQALREENSSDVGMLSIEDARKNKLKLF